MGAADGFCGLFNGGVKTKGARHEIDIVVDGFRHADHGDLQPPSQHFLRHRVGGFHGPVSADHEQDGDVHAFEGVDDFLRRLRTA